MTEPVVIDGWTSALVTKPSEHTLTHALERMGWRCIEASIDLCAQTARVSCVSFTGRRVTLVADGIGRCSVTREQYGTETVAVGRRGDRARVERATVMFLGRERFDGIRSGLRHLADYIGDNSPLGRQFARQPFRALLNQAANNPHKDP